MAGTTEGKTEPRPYTSLHAPDLYAETNSIRTKETRDLLKAFQPFFVTERNANCQFLDVGCGIGHFTRGVILPSAQPCRRLVAVDSSMAMLEYAKRNFPHQLIKYEYLDIEGDVSSFLKVHGPFHGVYSFSTLHWAKDLHRALANISELMIPGSECLLVFLGRAFVFETFRHLSTMDPRRKYADILLSHIPASHDILDLSGQRTYLNSALGSAKLVTLSAEVVSKDGVGFTQTSEIDKLSTGNPIFSLLSEEQQSAFLDDILRNRPKWCELYNKKSGSSNVCYFVVHAVKKSESLLDFIYHMNRLLRLLLRILSRSSLEEARFLLGQMILNYSMNKCVI